MKALLKEVLIKQVEVLSSIDHSDFYYKQFL